MKKIIKNILPPFLFNAIKSTIDRPQTFHPVWNTLSYDPVKGVKMYFDPRGSWQRQVLDGTYDGFLFKRMKELDLKGKTIYDIGAHVGIHSLYFARLVGRQGKVYAFEPHPKNLERISLQLAENADLKPVVSVFDVALSDKKGMEEFTLNDDVESGRSSGGFIESADTIWDKGAFARKGFIQTRVKTLPIDSLEEIGIDRTPDILKIDVEGAEALVLKGGRKTIEKHRPMIFLEAHSMKAMFDVMSFLSSVSYEAKVIHEEKDGRCFLEARPKK